MERYIPNLDILNSQEPAERSLTLEERLRLSFGSQASLRQQLGLSGESVSVNIWFAEIQVRDLTAEDVELLNKARISAFYVLTVDEFADAIKKGDYDIWKLYGLEGSQCLIMTSYELYPRHKYLMVHYLAGKNCKSNRKTIKKAMFELADHKGCDDIMYMASNPAYARFIRGKPVSTLYKLERET